MSKGKTTRYRKNLKQRLLQQNPLCCWCKQLLTEQTATFEHLLPLSVGGTWKVSNLALACKTCNNERGSGWVTTR